MKKGGHTNVGRQGGVEVGRGRWWGWWRRRWAGMSKACSSATAMHTGNNTC